MDLLANIIINAYSIILLGVIIITAMKQGEKETLQYKLYMGMVQVAILLLTLDTLSRFDGSPGTVYPLLNHGGNFLLFALNLTLPSSWLLYVFHQIFVDERKTKRLFWSLLAINLLNMLIIIVSLPLDWFYYIDSNNVYHRGALFPLASVGTIAVLVIAYILILRNRKKIEKKHYFALAFFAVPPCAGIILQIFIYGMSFMLNLAVVSLFILFLNIQQQNIHTDYLTGINNRKSLDDYMRKKINMSNWNQAFGAIMLDFDDFKGINDVFGHDEGDIALKTAARLLSSCLRLTDFIARFGGDEFCVITDVSDEKELLQIVERIQECFKRYNETKEKPYKLSMSAGYSIYDAESGRGMDDFQKHLDKKMYENKQNTLPIVL
ncbi:diguanylate cyclase (GGDEF) domain-containing protein [Parasporobacterium paucivorans DSM 15970]|uniref:Diguanylate cyclase (GGDEF) domain-containing protein n=2 Tax=Parasporobacterium TaxID=115543 RepID=A0A1M6JL10_9FIRM|nr:diguanylate cyclase (GGDEF) domain-containing protein [Parasporobacterium paucivorans DSM 15970]